MKNETKFKNELKQRFKDAGWYFKKICERYHSGFPDILVTKNSDTFYIETKIDNNNPTPLQEKTLKDISRHGGNALLWRYVNKDKSEVILQYTKEGNTEKYNFVF